MKYLTKSISLLGLAISSYHCQKEIVYAPVGHNENQAVNESKTRSKNLMQAQRKAIEKWISQQEQKFYPTGLGYWASVPDLNQKPEREIASPISYQYWLKDFQQQDYYKKPVLVIDKKVGSINDLQAVEDAVNHLPDGQKVRLLVPSSLAYGSIGDEHKIQTDAPVIIDIEIIKH